MLIRQVKRHAHSGMWAYVEFSDENPGTVEMLGNMEFQAKEEAEDYSQGFAPGSYEYVEPISMKIKKLLKEYNHHSKRISELGVEIMDALEQRAKEQEKKE